jgi:hypothetical protein
MGSYNLSSIVAVSIVAVAVIITDIDRVLAPWIGSGNSAMVYRATYFVTLLLGFRLMRGLHEQGRIGVEVLGALGIGLAGGLARYVLVHFTMTNPLGRLTGGGLEVIWGMLLLQVISTAWSLPLVVLLLVDLAHRPAS